MGGWGGGSGFGNGLSGGLKVHAGRLMLKRVVREVGGSIGGEEAQAMDCGYVMATLYAQTRCDVNIFETQFIQYQTFSHKNYMYTALAGYRHCTRHSGPGCCARDASELKRSLSLSGRVYGLCESLRDTLPLSLVASRLFRPLDSQITTHHRYRHTLVFRVYRTLL